MNKFSDSLSFRFVYVPSGLVDVFETSLARESLARYEVKIAEIYSDNTISFTKNCPNLSISKMKEILSFMESNQRKKMFNNKLRSVSDDLQVLITGTDDKRFNKIQDLLHEIIMDPKE